MLNIAFESETTSSLLTYLRELASGGYVVHVVPDDGPSSAVLSLREVDQDDQGIVLRGQQWDEDAAESSGPLLEFRFADDATLVVH